MNRKCERVGNHKIVATQYRAPSHRRTLQDRSGIGKHWYAKVKVSIVIIISLLAKTGLGVFSPMFKESKPASE